MKLVYEEQLEDKNQRIAKLESKNKKYLDIIAKRDEELNLSRVSNADENSHQEEHVEDGGSDMLQLLDQLKQMAQTSENQSNVNQIIDNVSG